MASTITSNFQFSVSGNYSQQSPSLSESISLSTDLLDSGITSIASGSITATTDITVSVTSGLEGRLLVENLDAANYVTYGSTANLEFKLKAGEFAWQRLTPGKTTGWQANTAAVKIRYWLFAD